MSESISNSRLEAFCDGVFAIAITLLVIDIKLPHTAKISTNGDLWKAIGSIFPSIVAFLLSFCVILITWVNHHNNLKLVKKSSSSFLYANGFLLITVAFIPFPTFLLGEYILSNAASPAVVLYCAVISLQSIAWMILSMVAIRQDLIMNDAGIRSMKNNFKFGCFALILYSICAVLAIWIPLLVAFFIALTWIFWLIYGIRVKPVHTMH